VTIGLNRLMLGSATKSSSGMKRSNMTNPSGCSEQESSDRSMDTDEENDKVAHMLDDFNAFRQLDFLWLFDKHLKFSERHNFTLDDHAVSADDFQKMRTLNRKTLTQFFKGHHQLAGDDDDSDTDLAMVGEGADTELVGFWADENLDEEIKTLLARYENGRDLPVDIVAHFEYFYNTLECTF